MTKFLVVNSDDFGISEGVSRGIIEAHLNGIVTSTTTMVNMPTAEAAIQKAQQLAPKLGLGLHLTLSFGAPVSDPEKVPSLVTSEGRFVSTYGDLRKKIPEFNADDLERELIAQFERFCELAGCLPDHIDSHHGAAYSHPAAFDVMLGLAHEHDLPIRWSGAIDARYSLDAAAAKGLKDALLRHGKPRTCDRIVDLIFDFESGSRVERLKTGLKTIEEGYSELVVHVGYAEDLQEDYSFQREQELEAVMYPDVQQIITDEDIQLCNFGDLP